MKKTIFLPRLDVGGWWGLRGNRLLAELLLGGLVEVGGGGGGRSLLKMDLRPSMLESSARGVGRAS